MTPLARKGKGSSLNSRCFRMGGVEEAMFHWGRHYNMMIFDKFPSHILFPAA